MSKNEVFVSIQTNDKGELEIYINDKLGVFEAVGMIDSAVDYAKSGQFKIKNENQTEEEVTTDDEESDKSH